MNEMPVTALLSLASKGASLSIDARVYSLAAIQSILQVIKRNEGHLTIRNAPVKSLSALQSIADKHVTFEV